MKIKTLSLGLLIVSLILILQIQEVKANPSLVGTSTNNAATYRSFQRKGFFANGRFWVFYVEGSNMVYRTSTDGVTWSSSNTIKSTNCGDEFSIWFNGTYVHYAHTPPASGSGLFYRRGTPNSNGTITWSANEQTVIAGVSGVTLYYPFVSVDSSNYPWIAYNRLESGTRYPYITKSSTNDGTWSTPSGFPYQLSTTAAGNWVGSVVPLTNQKVYAVYAYSYTSGYGKLWNGTSWGNEEASMSDIEDSRWHSVVSIDDDVHLVFRHDVSYDLIYRWRNGTSGTWNNEETVQELTGAQVSPPVLSKDLSTNNLYMFWMGAPTTNHIYYKKRVNGVWDQNPTDWLDESADSLTGNDLFTSFYQVYDNVIGLVYMTKTSSPYQIRFAFLDFLAPSFGSITADTAVAGTQVTLSVTITDNIAVSKFKYCWNNTGSWVNETLTSFSSNPATFTGTWNGAAGKTVLVKVYANDTANNWAVSAEYSFHLVLGYQQPPSTRFVLTVKVTDSEGVFQANAKVSVWTRTGRLTTIKYTGYSGSASFSLASATYLITAEKNDLIASETIILDTDKSITLTLQPPPTSPFNLSPIVEPIIEPIETFVGPASWNFLASTGCFILLGIAFLTAIVGIVYDTKWLLIISLALAALGILILTNIYITPIV